MKVLLPILMAALIGILTIHIFHNYYILKPYIDYSGLIGGSLGFILGCIMEDVLS